MRAWFATLHLVSFAPMSTIAHTMLDLPTLSPMIYIASPDEPIFYLMTSYDASLEGQRLLSVIFELVYRALSYASYCTLRQRWAGPVRTAWLACWAARRANSSHAHGRSGNRGSSCNKHRPFCIRSSARLGRTLGYSGLQTGVPSMTVFRSDNGLSPRPTRQSQRLIMPRLSLASCCVIASLRPGN